MPAFSGLFAPHWRSDARGVIAGLTGYINKGHLARAVLEATAWQTLEVVEAMNADYGSAAAELRVDGGMTANNLLMQFLADVLDVPVVRPIVAETVSLGAAYAAGLAVGFWPDTDSLKRNWHKAAEWLPAMDRCAASGLPEVEEGRRAHARLARRRRRLGPSAAADDVFSPLRRYGDRYRALARRSLSPSKNCSTDLISAEVSPVGGDRIAERDDRRGGAWRPDSRAQPRGPQPTRRHRVRVPVTRIGTILHVVARGEHGRAAPQTSRCRRSASACPPGYSSRFQPWSSSLSRWPRPLRQTAARTDPSAWC